MSMTLPFSAECGLYPYSGAIRGSAFEGQHTGLWRAVESVEAEEARVPEGGFSPIARLCADRETIPF